MEKVLRIIDPLFGRNNIYRMQAATTVSLGPVMVGTTANKELPLLEVEIINENNYRKNLGAMFDEEGNPSHLDLQNSRKADFIGISASMTNAVPRAKKIIQEYKSMPENLRPKMIIVGGWHAGDSPEEFLLIGADVVVHGEGEKVISKLIEAYSNNQGLKSIPGISYVENGEIKRNGPEFITLSEEELEALPCPDFGLLRFSKISLFPMSRTRGCSGRCRFCRVRSDPRSISVTKFIENVIATASKGARKFFFVDDRSEEDLEGFQDCLERLVQLRRDYRFNITTQNRLSLAEKPEILALMVQAGVRTVAIGFESPIPEELRAMKKPINPNKMVEWTKIFKKSGLYVHAMMIFGYPISTCGDPKIIDSLKFLTVEQHFWKFWDFIKKAKPDTLQVLLYSPIVGTPDYEFLERENRIRKDLGWDFYDGTHLVFIPDEGTDPQMLQEKVMELMAKFYSLGIFWRFSRITLALRFLWLSLVTIAMPLLWIFQLKVRLLMKLSFKKAFSEAWKKARRSPRNALLAFGANKIIIAWKKNFQKINFMKYWATKP